MAAQPLAGGAVSKGKTRFPDLGGPMLALPQDLGFAARSLKRSPGFAVVAILTLALGIGAVSAIASVLYGVVLKPLPYEEPERVLLMTSAFPSMGFEQFWVSPPEFVDLAENTRSFEALGAYVGGAVNVAASDGDSTAPFRASAGYVSHEVFTVLGVGAALGQVITEAEDADGVEPVAVLSHELWQSAFGGGDVLGRRLELDGQSTTVIGVMPAGFDLRDEGFEIWLPLGLDRLDPGGWGSHYLYLVGRLADGTSLEQARAEIPSHYARWDEERGEDHHPSADGHPLLLTPLQEEMVGPVRRAIWTLFGAVGLVLAIACANVANLLLVRSESRRREIAVRAGLGAGRGRLLRQFLTEGVLLGLLGSALGLALGVVGLRVLLAVHPESLPRTGEIGLASPVVLFTLGVAVLTGLVFGLAPALHLGARNLATGLRDGLRTTGTRRQLLRRALVVVEVALAVVLVIGSVLMLQSFRNILSVDPGFDPEGLTSFRISLTRAAYPENADVAAFLARLDERLVSVPGVDAATMMSGLPPLRRVNANDTEFEGLEATDSGPAHNTDFWQFAAADYFEALGIELLEGRGFHAGDDAAAPAVVVINEATARTFWPGESPLGQRLRAGWGDGPWRTVVGVAKDVKQAGLDQPAGSELYFPIAQSPTQMPYTPRTYNVVVRSDLALSALAPALRAAVWELDPSLPVAELRTMNEVVYGTVARPRFLALLLGVFAGVALALAAIGTYGVLAYQVSERRREIGVRMALGAGARRVVGFVLGQGMLITAVGLGVGVAVSLYLSRFLSTLLFGVAPIDLVTYVAVPAFLAFVALLACAIPAMRAARIDPSVVLRYD